MEDLKNMKKQLMACAQSQIFGNMDKVDAKELGEVIDMIKDLEEAIYYCTVVEAMEEGKKEEPRYYQDVRKGTGYVDRDMDRSYGRMYYGEPSTSSVPMHYGEPMYMGDAYSKGMMDYDRVYGTRDRKEGRSGPYRKMYMETKEVHPGSEKSMKELEKYMEELSHDITEMIKDATPAEKATLAKKMNTLSGMIDV